MKIVRAAASVAIGLMLLGGGSAAWAKAPSAPATSAAERAVARMLDSTLEHGERVAAAHELAREPRMPRALLDGLCGPRSMVLFELIETTLRTVPAQRRDLFLGEALLDYLRHCPCPLTTRPVNVLAEIGDTLGIGRSADWPEPARWVEVLPEQLDRGVLRTGELGFFDTEWLLDTASWRQERDAWARRISERHIRRITPRPRHIPPTPVRACEELHLDLVDAANYLCLPVRPAEERALWLVRGSVGRLMHEAICVVFESGFLDSSPRSVATVLAAFPTSPSIDCLGEGWTQPSLDALTRAARAWAVINVADDRFTAGRMEALWRRAEALAAGGEGQRDRSWGGDPGLLLRRFGLPVLVLLLVGVAWMLLRPGMRRRIANAHERHAARLRVGFGQALRGAIVMCVLLALLEGLCRVTGWGNVPIVGDVSGLIDERDPIFTPRSDSGDTVVFAGAEVFGSMPVDWGTLELRVPKPARTFRVALFGGSSVYGSGVRREETFGRRLEELIREALPGHRIEVYNLGVPAWGMRSILPLIEELLELDPDLICLYTGHNELLAQEGRRMVLSIPRPLLEARARLRRSALFLSLQRGLLAARDRWFGGAEGASPGGVLIRVRDAGPAEWDSMSMEERRTRAWKTAQVAELIFEAALDRAAARCAERAVPLVLCVPPSDLTDMARLSLHHHALTDDQQTRWSAHAARGLALADSFHYAAAWDELSAALAIDDSYARVTWKAGICARELGLSQARELLERSRDSGGLSYRIPSALMETMRLVARRRHLPLVDFDRLFAAESEDGITDGRLLVDHVHPNPEGHQLIAREIFSTLRRHRLLPDSAGAVSVAESSPPPARRGP